MSFAITKTSLLEELDLDNEQGISLLKSIPQQYRDYRVPKKSQGSRLLHIPSVTLKKLQRQLLAYLYSFWQAPAYQFAAIFGRSFVDHARRHANRNYVAVMDLKDCFGQINQAKIATALSQLGCDNEASELICSLVLFRESLPQGAPTSPFLANLAMSAMDKRLVEFCRPKGINYSRYLDDLAFSADHNFRQLRGPISSLIQHQGFQLSAEKSKFMGRHQPQVVTGLQVNQKLRPCASYRANLTQDLRQYELHPRSVMARSLRAKLNYLKQFDHKATAVLMKRFPAIAATTPTTLKQTLCRAD